MDGSTPMPDRRIPNNQDLTKQAVKEALDDKRMEDLSQKMVDLSTQMTAGFTAVHTRQDITNGKVLINSSDITEIKGKANYDKVIWLIVTALVGVVTYFMTKG